MSDGEKMEKTYKPEGRYANYVEVGHNAFEFVFDFGQYYNDDDNEATHVHTRIVTSPRYARNLLVILQKSLEQYEKKIEGYARRGSL